MKNGFWVNEIEKIFPNIYSNQNEKFVLCFLALKYKYINFF